MRAGGGNLTTTHVEELSLCSLFLMDAAKKTDKEFNVHRSSTSHTIRDASRDIDKMAKILLERQVTSVTEGRDVPKFEDPTERGLKKMCNTQWVQETLSRNPFDDEVLTGDEQTIDLEFEIADAEF